MSLSAWQVLCGLEAWLVTQMARRPAQLSVRRLQDRHAELRQAASAGLWRVHLLAGAAGGPEAAEVAGCYARRQTWPGCHPGSCPY